MELIDLYTRAVGRELPEKNRADIEREIRTLIEDSLEDESQKAGRAPDEDMLVSLLQRLGSPEKMAASYLPPRYVIGPDLYPHFITTLRIVLAVVTVLAAVGTGLSLGASGAAAQNPFEIIGKIVSGLIGAMLQSTAIVILVFAAIQYFSPGVDLKLQSPVWDPRKLRAEPDPEKISLPSVIAEIIFTILALMIFVLYPQWIGVTTLQNGEWVHVPVLTETFFSYLPWIFGLWALQIGINVWMMAQGRWTPALRWTSIAHSALNILLLAWIITGPPIAALSAESIAQFGWGITADAAQQISSGMHSMIRLVLGLIIALEVLEMGKGLYKLLGRRLSDPLVLGK